MSENKYYSKPDQGPDLDFAKMYSEDSPSLAQQKIKKFEQNQDGIFRKTSRKRGDSPSLEKIGDPGLGVPVNDNVMEVSVIMSNGDRVDLTRGQFIDSLGNHEFYINSTVYDRVMLIKTFFDENGLSKESSNCSQQEIDQVFHNEIVLSYKENDKTRVYLNSYDLISILKTPFLYFNKIKRNNFNINQLISCLILQPGQFDELFTIEVRGPESPLLRNYIDSLAEMVNDELSKSDEISNMEELEKQAYELSGYVGKSFDKVVDEAKDFQEYFRFLLNKKDKIVITLAQNEYASLVAKEISKIHRFVEKKTKINKNLVIKDNNLSKFFYFQEVIDSIIEGPTAIVITLFINVPNLIDIAKYIEESNLHIRIALIDRIVSHNFSKAICFEIFGCDDNYNMKVFELKNSTLVKYKREFADVMINFDKTYKENAVLSCSNELKKINSI